MPTCYIAYMESFTYKYVRIHDSDDVGCGLIEVCVRIVNWHLVILKKTLKCYRRSITYFVKFVVIFLNYLIFDCVCYLCNNGGAPGDQ